jgi:hypothetical protein
VQTITLDKQVDVSACDSVGRTQGIQAAGAIETTAESLTPIALPENPIPLAYISSGFVNLLDFTSLDERVSGVYIPETVANRLGKRAGEHFYLKDMTRVDIRGIYKYTDTGAQTGLGYVILSPAPNNQRALSSCWIDIWPYNPKLTDLLYTTITSTGAKTEPTEKTQQPEVKQLNGKFGSNITAYSDYRNSPAVNTPLFALVLALLIGFAFTRLRRLELTSALHCGVRKLDLLKTLALESVPPLLLAAFSSLATFELMTYKLAESFPLDLAFNNFLPTALGYLLGISAALLITEEKNIFKYFKQR